MLQNLKGMQACGVEIALVNGKDIQQVYSSAGRSVRPGRGIMHSKTILATDRLEFNNECYGIIGSTNWTVANLCNCAMSVLLQLTQDAGREWFERIMGWPSVKLTPEIAREAGRRSRSRTSPPSSQRDWAA